MPFEFQLIRRPTAQGDSWPSLTFAVSPRSSAGVNVGDSNAIKLPEYLVERSDDESDEYESD